MASVVFYSDDSPPRVVTLDEAEVITIGRHPDSVVNLKSPSVSSHHATIKKRDKGFFVQDLGSSNGTRLNGADIEESMLNDGDRVSFGDVQAVFYAGAPPALGAPPPEPRVVVVPPPDAPRIAEAPSAPSVPPAPGRVRRRASSGYPDQSTSGCATAMFLTGFFVLAFFIGLSLRHLKETERSLVNDLMDRITKNMPRVKIEQD